MKAAPLLGARPFSMKDQGTKRPFSAASVRAWRTAAVSSFMVWT
jgi:hypothetical protein